MPLISSRRNTTALTAKDLAAFEADVAAGGFLRVTQPDPEALAVLAPFKAQVDALKAQYGGADITGDEVKAMIEDGLQATFGEGGSTGPYPYTGGLRCDLNSAAAPGNRASGLEGFDAQTGLWMPLESSRTDTLFVLSFNANGGDGYITLRDVPAERRPDIGVLDADVFQTRIDGLPQNDAGLPVISKLPVALYSTQSFAP